MPSHYHQSLKKKKNVYQQHNYDTINLYCL